MKHYNPQARFVPWLLLKYGVQQRIHTGHHEFCALLQMWTKADILCSLLVAEICPGY